MVAISELSPAKLDMFAEFDTWVQVACPRLSIDWAASAYSAPVLSTFEAEVALGKQDWSADTPVPMDYYAADGGPWSNGGTPRRGWDGTLS